MLQATARILRGNTRETDMIARYGGEEFVVVLPATDAETAHNICERIVMAFRNTGHVVGSDHAKVTVSIGCATHGAQIQFPNYAEFVKAANQALYTAKMRGRNRTVPFDRQLATPPAKKRLGSTATRLYQSKSYSGRSYVSSDLSCVTDLRCRQILPVAIWEHSPSGNHQN